MEARDEEDLTHEEFLRQPTTRAVASPLRVAVVSILAISFVVPAVVSWFSAPRALPPAAIPTRLSCDAGQASGSPDYSFGARGSGDPSEQADRWARGSGFTGRFPAAVGHLASSRDGNEVVFFEEPSGAVRAILTFSPAYGGWRMTSLEYC